MNDLVTWLRVQLDEDEQVARHAAGQDWRRALSYAGDLTEHVDAHNPTRVLAEVEAKRRILDDCADYDDVPGVTDGLSVRVPMLLALPYAERPGYLDEWRLA